MPSAAAAAAALACAVRCAGGLRTQLRGGQGALVRGPAWGDVITGLQSEQARLVDSTEKWIGTAQSFEQEWAKGLSQRQKEVEGKLKVERKQATSLKDKLSALCPMDCKRDAMRFAEFSMSGEATQINVDKAKVKVQIAHLTSEQTEVKVLGERVMKYAARINKLRFKVKEELQEFESILSSKVGARVKETALLDVSWGPFRRLFRAIKKAVKRVVQKIKSVFRDKRPTKAQLVKPFEMKKKRIQSERAACDAMRKFERDATATRGQIAGRRDGEMKRLQGNVLSYNKRTQAAAQQADAFAQVQAGFTAICQEEKDSWIALQDKLSGLEPRDLKGLLSDTVDKHHEWWRDTCQEVKTLAGGITSWMASCKSSWQSAVLGAEENMEALEGMPKPQSLDGLTKAASGACRKDFNAEAASVDQQMSDVHGWCNSKMSGGLVRKLGGVLGIKNCKK